MTDCSLIYVRLNVSPDNDATISVNSIGFDKDTDYSELMNEYLSKGGKTSDNTYK